MSTINKYHNGRIYKIVSHQTSDVYIGSTCRSLKERLREHRKHYKGYLNGKYHYVTSYEILKYDDHDIILLEYFKCLNKEELHARERYYIESMTCVNKIVPGRTIQQWREDNKDVIADKSKQYRNDNKEDLVKYMKQWRNDNKEIIAEKSKQYRNDNKEYMEKYMKQYYDDNKKEIAQRKKQKYICECGRELSHGDKAKHERTQRHIAIINNITNSPNTCINISP